MVSLDNQWLNIYKIVHRYGLLSTSDEVNNLN